MWLDERSEDAVISTRAALSGHEATMWTALPGIVMHFDSDCTATIRPALKGTIRGPNNQLTQVPMPLLQKCPVIFPGGAGLYMTHPVAPNDECLVVFSSRCIDSWWQAGGVQAPLVLRMHDLSDGFCIPGAFSVPNVLPNISQNSIQIRTKMLVLLDLNPTTPMATFNVPVTINGALQVNGTGTATVDFISNGKSGHGHEHDYNPGSGSLTATTPPI